LKKQKEEKPMACCGQKRSQITTQPAIPQRQNINPAPPIAAPRRLQPQSGASVVSFQYTGTTALTAIGPLSGRRYHFAAPGAILQVDARDRASLATVPQLRQV
jgi:hypothetical protein